MADVTGTTYAASATHGYLAEWLIGDGGTPEGFEAVYGVTRITPGDMTTAVIDKTHLRSPAAHREKLAGLRDSGPFTIEMIYNPDHESHTNAGGGTGSFQSGGLFYLWINRVERNMEIRVNDTSPQTTIPFRGVITRCQIGEIGPDDKILLTAEVTPLQDFSSDLP